MCRLKGSHESQTTGILLICHELQRLLRLAFVGNVVIYCNSAINLFFFFNAKPFIGVLGTFGCGCGQVVSLGLPLCPMCSNNTGSNKGPVPSGTCMMYTL